MSKKNTQLVIFIILPILSVMIGYFGVKIFLEANGLAKIEEETPEVVTEEPVEKPPVIIDNTEPTDTEVEVVADKTFEFDSLKIYAVQAGAFSGESNANTYKKEMNDKGFGGHVYKTSKYKVYVSVFLNEVIAKEYASEFNSVVEGAYATAITIENENMMYPSSEIVAVESLGVQISKYLKVVDRLNAVMINDFSQEYPLEHNDFLDILATEKSNIENILETIGQLELNYEESKRVKDNFNTLLEDVIAKIESIEKSDRKSNWMMTDLLMTIAFEYGSIN